MLPDGMSAAPMWRRGPRGALLAPHAADGPTVRVTHVYEPDETEAEVAEIRVERKQRSVLPWVLGVLVLAVIAFAVFRVMGGNKAAAAASEPAVQVDSAK